MVFEFDIECITIVKSFGPDSVVMKTSHPNPYVDESVREPLNLEFNTTADRAEEYVKENFPDVPVKVVDTKSSRQKTYEVLKARSEEIKRGIEQ